MCILNPDEPDSIISNSIAGLKVFMKSFLLILFFTACLILVFSFPSVAEENESPHIADILITTSQNHLLLFCSIKNSFTPEMIEGIHNGIPVTFTFHISLDIIKSKWFDSTITDMALQHTLTYDSLKEEYRIDQSEKSKKPSVTDSLDEAIDIMSELNGIRIIDRNELTPDVRYAMNVKAKLAEKTLPMYMHYIIPFISLWDFETDWRTIEFQY